MLSEAFLQHAEHYMRILSASQPSRNEERSQEDRPQEDRQDDGRSAEERSGQETGAAEAGEDAEAVSESLAVIGADAGDQGSGIVETPEGAGAGRRRGRRPLRRGAKSDDAGGQEEERSGRPRRKARSEGGDEDPSPELELEAPQGEPGGDETIRAAE